MATSSNIASATNAAAPAASGEARPAGELATEPVTLSQPNEPIRVDSLAVLARSSIERSNQELLVLPRNELPLDVAREVVKRDLYALSMISDKDERFFSAATMADSAQQQGSYDSELSKQDVAIALEVAAASVEEQRRFANKSARKDIDVGGDPAFAAAYSELIEAQRRRNAAANTMPKEAEREVNEVNRGPALARMTPVLADQQQARELEAAYAQQREGRRRGRPSNAEKARRESEAQQVEAQRAKDAKTQDEDFARVAAARARDSAQVRDAMGRRAADDHATRTNSIPDPAPSPRTDSVEREDPVPNPALLRRLPTDVAEQFVATKGDGYARRSTPAVVEFRDYGDALRAENNSADTADMLVRIAKEREFGSIKVRGTEAFRREVWIEATARELTVSGYTPEPRDEVEMLRRAKVYGKTAKKESDINVVERGEPRSKVVGAEEALRAALPAYLASQGVTAPDPAMEEAIQRTLAKRAQEIQATPPKVAIRPIQGVVIDSGKAPYLMEPGGQESFYVRLLRDDGKVVEKWGKTLSKTPPENLRVGTEIEITKSATNALLVSAVNRALVNDKAFAAQAKELNGNRDAEQQRREPDTRDGPPGGERTKREAKSIPPPMRARGRA